MKRIVLAVAGMLAPLALTAAPADAQAVRHYDCTKAGNANKAVCKGGATPPAVAKAAPIAPATRTTPAARHYDCSKAGNAKKAVCKGTVAAVAPSTAPHSATIAVPAPRAAPIAPSARAPVAGQNTNPAGPNGATAKCRDGSMSFSAHRSGTCSRHGGVAQFF